jgi:endonuclease YncB( thermonuclease family)
MPKKKNPWKKILVSGVVASSIGLGFWASKAFYTVKEVIDGDTFITQENKHIRLDSVNAPELGLCLGKESKKELEKLILNKKVFIKVTYINGLRLVGSVFTSGGNVGERMLETGMATYEDKGNQIQKGLLKVSQTARESGVGIYSPICTQTENPINSKCDIKGNITKNNSFYRYPGCNFYKTTLVQLHLGDQWFCTEKEARSAGFTRGNDCL